MNARSNMSPRQARPTVACVLFLAACDLRWKQIPGYGVLALALLAWPHPRWLPALAALAVAVVFDRVMRATTRLAMGVVDLAATFAVALHLGWHAPLLVATSLLTAALTRRFLHVRSVAVIPFLAACLI